MASFRKSGNGWRAEITKKGIRESSTFPTKREAQEWAATREAEITNMRAGKVIRWTLSKVLDRYMTEISPSPEPARHRAGFFHAKNTVYSTSIKS